MYDILEEKDEIYLVFEYVEGKTIDKLLDEQRKVDVNKTIKIMEQICEAMNYAHNEHVVHRDLKPANIRFTPDARIKIMDFGIARVAIDTLTALTGKGDASGTLRYMSTEQHSGSSDFRSDIYSLGVIFYELLSGKVPFKGPDFITQKREMVYTPIREICPQLQEEVEVIIRKCLQPDKDIKQF
ncbi:MAG: serine/threonine-protein kinase [Candidatus Firestonebacteria bacterium]